MQSGFSRAKKENKGQFTLPCETVFFKLPQIFLFVIETKFFHQNVTERKANGSKSYLETKKVMGRLQIGKKNSFYEKEEKS